jgi:geranylgeranyl diphosphate synthase type II
VPLESLLGSGKRVRPLVTLLSCEVAGGSAEKALDAAVGVELLHTASLIHDDMMDRALLRRGKPTLHSAYPENIALLCGDYVVALAYEQMLRVPPRCRETILGLTNATYRMLCEGQALEETLREASQATKEQLLEIVEKKTASLVQLAACIGAHMASASPDVCSSLGRFGRWLGIAFQIQDDILDAVGNEEETGKDRLLDRKNQQLTFVTSAGDKHLEAEGASQGVLLAVEQSEYYMEQALAVLREFPPSGALDDLRQFSCSLLNRRM